jgi:2-phosphosulfolactate phosphatase
MCGENALRVHLLPQLARADQLGGGVAVVIDVLRAATTVVHALAAGAAAVWPVATVEEASEQARRLRAENRRVVVGGERGGKPVAGFDLGNSPSDYCCRLCKDAHVVLTTTNGTAALLHVQAAEVVHVAGFVNFSAVGELLLKERRPIHLVCSGTDGHITLEDTLLAGAFVDLLQKKRKALCDSARLAWDCFEHHGMILTEALRLSQGGRNLIELGYEDDLAIAAQVDRFQIVPTLRRHPPRLEIGGMGLVRNLWPQR